MNRQRPCYIKQLGASGSGDNDFSSLDWTLLGRSAISGAITGGVTAGFNALINSNGIANLLDKVGINNNAVRNIVGNTMEGLGTGAIAGGMNGLGSQYIINGFDAKWDWAAVGKSVLLGLSRGGALGTVSGVVQEIQYQRQLDKGYSPWRSSDIADASGEFAGSTTSHLEATNNSTWPFGHNYAHEYVDLPGVIYIGTRTRQCTITIDPYAPMVPTKPTYYYPKP